MFFDKDDEQRLNEAAIEWKTAQLNGGNEALEQQLWEKVFLLAYKLFEVYDSNPEYEDYSDRLLKRFTDVLKKYNPEYNLEKNAPTKRAISHYLNFSLKKETLTIQELKSRREVISLDAKVSDEKSFSVEEVAPDLNSIDPLEALRTSMFLEDFTAMILNFYNRHSGRAANETRHMWFRLFYTEDVTNISKDSVMPLVHERDIFKAMNQSYLDYYMSRTCRTLKKIQVTPLKQYQDVVPSCDMKLYGEETAVPLPAAVSIAYLKVCENIRVGRSARSNQYSEYKKERKWFREQLRG